MTENGISPQEEKEELLITLPHLKALQKELKKYNLKCISDVVDEFKKGVDDGSLMFPKVVNKTNVLNIFSGQVRNQLAMLCLYKAGTIVLERYKEKARELLRQLQVTTVIPELSEEDKAAYEALPKKKTRYKKVDKVLVKL